MTKTCSCGRDMVHAATTAMLGAFVMCPHCDVPCKFGPGCVRCVTGKRER